MDRIDASISDRADAAVDEYLRRIDRGEVVDREQFITAHRDVAKELKEFFVSADLLRSFIRLSRWTSAGCH